MLADKKDNVRQDIGGEKHLTVLKLRKETVNPNGFQTFITDIPNENVENTFTFQHSHSLGKIIPFPTHFWINTRTKKILQINRKRKIYVDSCNGDTIAKIQSNIREK